MHLNEILFFTSYITVCVVPMGVENSYLVKDKQITSSSAQDNGHEALQGRLFGQESWIPTYVSLMSETVTVQYTLQLLYFYQEYYIVYSQFFNTVFFILLKWVFHLGILCISTTAYLIFLSAVKFSFLL